MSNGYTGDYAGDPKGKYKPELAYYIPPTPVNPHSVGSPEYISWREENRPSLSDRMGYGQARRDYDAAMEIWGAPEQKWGREGAEPARQLGAATEAELMKSYHRQISDMRGRLGYARSSGAGTSGSWGALGGAIERRGMGVLARAATASEQVEAQMKNDFMNAEDKNAFMATWENKKQDYRRAEIKRQAELNEPAWWATVGKVVGSAAAIGFGVTTGNPFAVAGGAYGLTTI